MKSSSSLVTAGRGIVTVEIIDTDGKIQNTMQAVRFKTDVPAGGRVELPEMALKEGTFVEVIVLVPEREPDFTPLLEASLSNTDFWDNPLDDQVWNNA